MKSVFILRLALLGVAVLLYHRVDLGMRWDELDVAFSGFLTTAVVFGCLLAILIYASRRPIEGPRQGGGYNAAFEANVVEAELANQEVPCNRHPKAPHGFSRNRSHSAGRYVCDCEGWDAWEAGHNAGMRAAIDAEAERDALEHSESYAQEYAEVLTAELVKAGAKQASYVTEYGEQPFVVTVEPAEDHATRLDNQAQAGAVGMLEDIASYLGCGGYNGATPEQLSARIRDEFDRLNAKLLERPLNR